MSSRRKSARFVTPDGNDERPAKRRRQSVSARLASEQDALQDIESRFTESGKVFVLGNGDCGQLGLGEDVTEKFRPAILQFPGNEEVIQVVAGGMHSTCLCKSGHVYTWGVNDEGALGRYTEGEAWKQSGKGKGKPGDSYTPALVKMPAKTDRIVQLSAGDSHTAALTIKGSVLAWGTFRDSGGVMGFSASQRIAVEPVTVYHATTEEDQVIYIASGVDHIAALTRGLKVLTWGSGQQGQLGRIGPRMSDRFHGKLEVMLTPTALHLPVHLRDKPATIACGNYSTYVVTQGGKVYSCGLNNYGQLGAGKVDMLFAPKLASAFKGHNIASVASGEHHTLALTQDGKVISLGRPTYGRLGRQEVDVACDVPVEDVGVVEVEGLEGEVAGISAGPAVSGCFSNQMCGLWMCGFGTNGQLGKGDEDDDDETLMTRVRRTKAFNEVIIQQLQFGGQHAIMLGVPTNASE